MTEGTDSAAASADAAATIARQAAEIARLQRRLEDQRFAEELQAALAMAATAGTIASPVTHSRLLEMIVETAAHVTGSHAASLFLIDADTQELRFEVALGQKADAVKKFTVPLGHGIAGLVAMSGQPLAVSDAQRDPRQAADIAQSVGYVPNSILCVPLLYNDEIIGVLELLDKAGATSFSPADMETVGFFANQAAVAIEQSRTHRNLAALIRDVLGSFSGLPEYERERLAGGARAFAAHMEEDTAYRQALDLARLVQEIAWQGDHELQACRTILGSFATYLRTRPEQTGGLEMWR